MSINLRQLTDELAGLPVIGIQATGSEIAPGIWDDAIIQYAPEATAQDMTAAEAIKATHIAKDTSAIADSAKDAVTNIPGWASWTEQQVLDWITVNVQPEIGVLAPDTYIMLRAMARLLVALRNKQWPSLQG